MLTDNRIASAQNDHKEAFKEFLTILSLFVRHH